MEQTTGKTTNKPAMEFHSGVVRAAVWENENDNGEVYRNIVMTRPYKDATGNWKRTSSWREKDLNDVENVIRLLRAEMVPAEAAA